jgi:acyl carrier protein
MSSFERLQEAVATILKVPPDRINERTAKEDLAQWDSLAHLNLMMALEQTFDVALDVEDFDQLTSVPRIIEYLTRHGAYE